MSNENEIINRSENLSDDNLILAANSNQSYAEIFVNFLRMHYYARVRGNLDVSNHRYPKILNFDNSLKLSELFKTREEDNFQISTYKGNIFCQTDDGFVMIDKLSVLSHKSTERYLCLQIVIPDLENREYMMEKLIKTIKKKSLFENVNKTLIDKYLDFSIFKYKSTPNYIYNKSGIEVIIRLT